jgi:hydrogenase large subunit
MHFASVRSVEDALNISVPKTAELVRNLMFCTQYMQDHVVHFYHSACARLGRCRECAVADPNATSDVAKTLSNYPKTSPGYFSDLQKRLKTFVDSGQLGIFANGYWGHPGYKLPKEVNLIAVAHYSRSSRMAKEIVKVHTIFGGKNPHPNYSSRRRSAALSI